MRIKVPTVKLYAATNHEASPGFVTLKVFEIISNGARAWPRAACVMKWEMATTKTNNTSCRVDILSAGGGSIGACSNIGGDGGGPAPRIASCSYLSYPVG